MTFTPTNRDVSSFIDPSTSKFYTDVSFRIDAKWDNSSYRPTTFEYTRLNNEQGVMIYIPSTNAQAVNEWHCLIFHKVPLTITVPPALIGRT